MSNLAPYSIWLERIAVGLPVDLTSLPVWVAQRAYDLAIVATPVSGDGRPVDTH